MKPPVMEVPEHLTKTSGNKIKRRSDVIPSKVVAHITKLNLLNTIWNFRICIYCMSGMANRKTFTSSHSMLILTGDLQLNSTESRLENT